jgi:hypothetical protein
MSRSGTTGSTPASIRGANTDVTFVRWPAQVELRNECERAGTPRLLVVEAGASPPVCTDPFEDWVRTPITRDDLDARVRALRNRLGSRQSLALDPSGTLTFGLHSIALSSLQTEMMELFVAHFGEVVHRDDLALRLAPHTQNASRNSLDLHIMRLRRRLSSTGLIIRTVWRRGYVLESSDEEREES